MSHYLTSLFIRAAKKHFHTRYALLQDVDIHPGQPPLLFALSKKDGQIQKDLAAQLHIQAATLTVMLNRMEKNGLVERRTDERDQRVTRVYLTEQGREVKEKVSEAINRMEAICFRNFSESEKEQFSNMLQRMIDNLESNEIASR